MSESKRPLARASRRALPLALAAAAIVVHCPQPQSTSVVAGELLESLFRDCEPGSCCDQPVAAYFVRLDGRDPGAAEMRRLRAVCPIAEVGSLYREGAGKLLEMERVRITRPDRVAAAVRYSCFGCSTGGALLFVRDPAGWRVGGTTVPELEPYHEFDPASLAAPQDPHRPR